MTKPVTQSNLLNAITSVMGTARADQTPASSLTADRDEQFVPRKILLAEDGLVNRKVAVDLLQKRGHQVTAVENGQLAVDGARSGQFDLILMDVQMPVLDGFAATAAIRAWEAERGQRLPIIAMTAHAMKGDRQRCIEAGMDDYVSKPFRPQELFGAVEKVTPRVLAAVAPPTSADAADDKSVAATASPENSNPPPFDYARALENVGGSDELLADVIELFDVEGPKQLADIEAAFQAGDAELLMRAAHSLKSSAALFASERAAAAAGRIEVMGRVGQLGDFEPVWQEVKQRTEELLDALRTWNRHDS